MITIRTKMVFILFFRFFLSDLIAIDFNNTHDAATMDQNQTSELPVALLQLFSRNSSNNNNNKVVSSMTKTKGISSRIEQINFNSNGNRLLQVTQQSLRSITRNLQQLMSNPSEDKSNIIPKDGKKTLSIYI